MLRRALATTAFVLTISLSQVVSAQAAPGVTTGMPQQSGNTVLLGTGPTTPIVTFAAPAPTAGISNAGRAGISNSEPLPSNLPGPSNTVVYYTQPGVQTVPIPQGVYEGTAPAGSVVQVAPGLYQGTVPVGSVVEVAPAVIAPTGNAAGNMAASESGGRTTNDLGPSYFADSVAPADSTAPAENTMSLAQVAAQFKAAKASATTNARALTNQEVQQMLNSKAGVTVAKNMPPLGPGAIPSGVSQGPAPPSTAASTAAPQNAVPSTQTAQGGAGQQTGTPPPVESTPSQPAGSTTAAGSTTPQVNPNPQSNDAQGKSKLPATATILPLLGLLGAMSWGIGLWFRRFRR